MKKTCMTFIVLFTLAISFCFGAVIYAVSPDESTVSPMGSCTNHNFAFQGYHEGNNQHTYYCTNTGCTMRLVEECYYHGFCGMYPYDETTKCERCGYGDVIIEHDFAPYHDWISESYTHNMKCQNFDEYFGSCDALQYCAGDFGGELVEVACSLGPIYIWRGYDTVYNGHILTRTCEHCNYQYTWGYHQIELHADGQAPGECDYCDLEEPCVIYPYQ